MPRSARLTERSVKIDFLAQSFAVALLPSYRPTLTRRLKIVLVLVVSVLVLDKWGCGAGVLEYLAKSELRLAFAGLEVRHPLLLFGNGDGSGAEVGWEWRTG